MSKRNNDDAPIQFRPFAPNPAGGEWPRLSEQEISAKVEMAHDAMKHIFIRKLVPNFLAQHRGDTKLAAESISTLFIGMLHNFLADNVEEGEEKTRARIAKATKAVLDYTHAKMELTTKLLSTGLPPRLVAVMLHEMMQRDIEPELHVFEVKPGEDLPEELLRFLRN